MAGEFVYPVLPSPKPWCTAAIAVLQDLTEYAVALSSLKTAVRKSHACLREAECGLTAALLHHLKYFLRLQLRLKGLPPCMIWWNLPCSQIQRLKSLARKVGSVFCQDEVLAERKSYHPADQERKKSREPRLTRPPGSDQDHALETSLICILLSASHDVLFDKRMIWFSGLDCEPIHKSIS